FQRALRAVVSKVDSRGRCILVFGRGSALLHMGAFAEMPSAVRALLVIGSWKLARAMHPRQLRDHANHRGQRETATARYTATRTRRRALECDCSSPAMGAPP